MSLVYLFSLFVLLFGFTVYPLVSKKYIGITGHREFVPLFLLCSVVGAVILPLIVYHSFFIQLSYVPLIALLGLMYTVAAYLFFYSIENYNVGIISSIVGSQEVFIALFTALFFIIADVASVIIPFLIIIVGIILLANSNTGKSKFSKYVIFAFAAVLIWVFMWVFFYTIKTSFPLSYYAALQFFAFVFCLPLVAYEHRRSKKHKLSVKVKKYTVFAGLLNGAATATFAFSYKINAILTPFVAQLAVPLALILSVVLLRERLKKLEVVALVLIIAGTFLYIII